MRKHKFAACSPDQTGGLRQGHGHLGDIAADQVFIEGLLLVLRPDYVGAVQVAVRLHEDTPHVGAALGVANTESVMQQGQGFDEDQRALQADDVATYQMAMTGLDETAGTADDYTINMTYGGIQANTSGCDIVVKSTTDTTVTSFAQCNISGGFLSANHRVITSGTFTYFSDRNDWFFNQELSVNCTVNDTDLTFSNLTHLDAQVHQACNSITYGPGYILTAAGSVEATAPSVTLGPGTTINGLFTINSAVP